MFNIFANVIKTATREESWAGGRKDNRNISGNPLLREQRDKHLELKRLNQNARHFSGW